MEGHTQGDSLFCVYGKPHLPSVVGPPVYCSAWGWSNGKMNKGALVVLSVDHSPRYQAVASDGGDLVRPRGMA